jgi:hypothetical protein
MVETYVLLPQLALAACLGEVTLKSNLGLPEGHLLSVLLL